MGPKGKNSKNTKRVHSGGNDRSGKSQAKKPRIEQPHAGNKKSKIFNDPVHGHIAVNSLCVKIIDTPQFQRLRYLKQLGSCYFVYPGAPHNRFEHSIGVYHLAGEFARALKENHKDDKDVEITEKDIQCIEIAGLCHDLGHGPFSHLFDGPFMSRVNKGNAWKHEKASLDMFDYLMETNMDVKKELESFDERDIKFIKELIDGPSEEGKGDHEGRPEKMFLYEIVSNKRNGIDVDKWDYFARDCHMLGIKNTFDHKRYMMLARVIDVKDEGMQICMRDKEAGNVYDMFHTRATLHRVAYQHKVTVGIDLMIVDVLVNANEHIKIPGKGGNLLRMSDCITDMEAYCKLNDGILQAISLSSDKNLKKSQDVLRRLHSRQLYTCIGESIQRIESEEAIPIKEEDLPTIRKNIIDSMPDEVQGGKLTLKEDDIEVKLRNFNYGMKNKDPVNCVRFYRKNNTEEAFTMKRKEVSTMLPERFEERVVAVYVKDSKDYDKHQLARRCLEEWCKASKKAPNMEKPKIWLRPSLKIGSETEDDSSSELAD